MSKPVRVRFAPSPTGYLHVGGARTALFNWLFARRNGGTFVLRVEDTDAARNTPEAVAAILDGMRWLGLDWDEGPEVGGEYGPYYQSERGAIYQKHADRLVASGHAYTDESGALRFRLPRLPIVMDDQVCGRIEIDRSRAQNRDGEPEADMTLRRADGGWIFHFVNVVDDLEMGITHVIRGEDHLMNTPKHIELFQALGAEPPVYAHIPLILNMDGSKMSKRDQGAELGRYAQEGFVPEAVVNFLCLLGWSPKDDRQVMSVQEVIPLFDWDHLNRSAAKFDYEKCLWLNSQYLAAENTEAFTARAKAWLGPVENVPADKLDAAIVLLKPKIKHLPELREHFSMLFDAAASVEAEARAKATAKPETKAGLERVAGDFATLEVWTAESLKASVESSAKALGVKPGALLFPLRVAITGQGHGADLMPALELLGREAVLARLAARTAQLFG